MKDYKKLLLPSPLKLPDPVGPGGSGGYSGGGGASAGGSEEGPPSINAVIAAPNIIISINQNI